MQETRKYGLFTAIAMITGIVIGSGIFFKSDDILVATQGDVFTGIITFIIVAISIIFGSLSISQLASRTDRPGGIIAYAEEFCSTSIGCMFGWFQTFLYLPSIAAVVAWAAGMFTCALFGLPDSLGLQVLIGTGYLIILSALNLLSAKLGGYFQNASMIIKLIPLVLVAILGLAFGVDKPEISTQLSGSLGTASLLAAIPAIAFSFDGWIVSTSICHEIKNSKRNLPLALIISPILILIIYVAYFVGMSRLVGPDRILELGLMNQGNSHVDEAFTHLFGANGSKLLLVFVVISVLGTVNGLVLGATRLPYAMALRGMIPGFRLLRKEVPSLAGAPFYSGVFSLIIALLWMVVHFVTQSKGLLKNSDVSEISIVVNYASYIVLYIAVIRMAMKKEIPGVLSGYITPILAIIGACIIIAAGTLNPLMPWYCLFCIIVVLIAYLYAVKNKGRIEASTEAVHKTL